jgi:PIN domain nuclease of toxin-antitoxin system
MTSTSPGTSVVADTMAVVLWLEKRRLPAQTHAIFQQASVGQITIYIPGMVFAEMLYLHERGRISASITDAIDLTTRRQGFREMPLSGKVALAAVHIDDIPELHDRLIAASGVSIGAPVVTNDPLMHASRWVTSFWL